MTYTLFILLVALMFCVAYLVGLRLMPRMPPTPPEAEPTQAPQPHAPPQGSGVEFILAWFVVGVLALISACIVIGSVGYIWQRWLA